MSEQDVDFNKFDGEVNTYALELEPLGEYLLELKSLVCKNTRTGGPSLFVEFVVRESNNPKVLVGQTRAWKQTDIFGDKNPDAKGPKQRNIRELLAALTGKDTAETAGWGQAVQYASAKNIFGMNVKNSRGELLRGGKGVYVYCKTGPKTPVRNNPSKSFIAHKFSAHVAGE